MADRLYEFGQEKVFPERYASWAWASVARALKMHARKRFDVVVATGNPFASFGAAWLFNRLTGVPYVMDYRDSWTLDLFNDEPAFPEGDIAWSWEKKALERASAAVFVNEALRGWHAERYPEVADRMMVVPNGWDADVIPEGSGAGDRPETVGPDDPEKPLTFSYLGTLTAKQPVEEMAEAFRIARRHPELAGAELQIHGHLGFFKNSPQSLLKRLGLDDAAEERGDEDTGLRYCGPVSKTEVGEVYENADVLVFLVEAAGSTSPRERSSSTWRSVTPSSRCTLRASPRRTCSTDTRSGSTRTASTPRPWRPP